MRLFLAEDETPFPNPSWNENFDHGSGPGKGQNNLPGSWFFPELLVQDNIFSFIVFRSCVAGTE